MKKLIAVLAVMFSVNAEAFVGTGNENMEAVRGYQAVNNNGDRGSTKELQDWSIWMGKISGLASVFSEPAYDYAICYPEGATLGQQADIAANYLIEHPEKRAKYV